MTPDDLKQRLCSAFCSSVSVNPVASGLAVSSAFSDSSGDKISFYVMDTVDGLQIEDDGDYLSNLVASDFPIDQGQRGAILDAMLAQGGAYWDRDTFEIKSEQFTSDELPRRAIAFLSSLIRVRDLELFTRETVRSTFREDAMEAIKASFSGVADIEEQAPVSDDFAEFPADIVLTPKPGVSGVKGAIYLVNSNDKLNEALLLQSEAQLLRRDFMPQELGHSFEVIGLLEYPSLKTLSPRKFQRAQNRSLAMPIFKGDEKAAMHMIRQKLKLPMAA